MADEIKSAIDDGAERTRSATDRAAEAAKSATDAMRDAGEKARETFQDKVVDPARRAGEAMKASGQKVAEGGSQIGLKMIDQAENNVHQAFAAMRDAARAKDLSDVMRIQGDYLREQGQRSMAQAREIGELIMQFGRDSTAPFRGESDKDRSGG